MSNSIKNLLLIYFRVFFPEYTGFEFVSNYKSKYVFLSKSIHLFSKHLVPIVVQVLFKTLGWGFPGGAVVENLPANTGDAGSSPGLGGSHMPRSDWAHEPQLLSLRVWSPCSATGEATVVRGPRAAMRSGPRLPQLEKALAQKRRPNTAKNKKKKRH